MKDMKSYLSEQLLLCYIGKDEKQTEYARYVKKIPCTLVPVCVKGYVARFN